MSNKRTFSKFSQPQEKKKYCKVCHEAGKSEHEYTSHFTKSTPGANGIVICPTILSSECKFCFQRGHWASEEHCPALRQKKKQEKKEEYNNRRENYKSQQTSVCVKTPHLKQLTTFAALCEREEPSNETEAKIEEFPPLGNASVKVRKLPTTTSYADMAKKEAPIIVREEESTTEYEVLTSRVGMFQQQREKSNLFSTAVTSGRAGNFEELEITRDYYDEYDDGEEYYGEEYDEDYENDWRVPDMQRKNVSYEDENW